MRKKDKSYLIKRLLTYLLLMTFLITNLGLSEAQMSLAANVVAENSSSNAGSIAAESVDRVTPVASEQEQASSEEKKTEAISEAVVPEQNKMPEAAVKEAENTSVDSKDKEATASKEQKEDKTEKDNTQGAKEKKEDKKHSAALEKQKRSALIYTDSTYKTENENDKTVITLEGKLPHEAEVRAYPVEVKIDNADTVLAYDITIFDKLGKEYQPDEEAAIQVKIISEKLKDIENPSVFHMKDKEDTPEKITEKVSMKDEEVSFEAKSFSIYVIGRHEHEDAHYHTYHFFDKDGHEIVANQEKIEEGEVLKEPQAPMLEHFVFDGWYTEQAGGHKFTDWVVEGRLTENKSTNLYARYREVYHVYYKAEAREPTDENPVMVIHTQNYKVDSNSILDYTDVPFPLKEGEALVGWSLSSDGTKPIANHTMKVDSDLRLFPIVKKAYWITYDSQGGSYTEPNYVLEGQLSKAPQEHPTKPGYTFAGWYLMDGTLYTFGQTLPRNLTLVAHWHVAPTNYTVVYWQQDVNDDKYANDANKSYNFVSSKTMTAYPGDYVSADNTDKRLNTTNNMYKHFHYNTARDYSVQVKADGTTVVNVYYDRDMMYINFDRGSEIFSGLYGSSFARNHYTWPERYGYAWRNTIENNYLSFLDGFTFTDSSYNHVNNTMYLESIFRGNQGATVEHFKQELDGSWSTAPANSSLATATNFTLTNKYEGFSVSEKRSSFIQQLYIRYRWQDAHSFWEIRQPAKEFDRVYINRGGGYTEGFYNGQRARVYYDDLQVFYKRNQYKLKYSYGVNQEEISSMTTDVLYEAPIDAQYNKAEPARPQDSSGNPLIPSYYTFKGWFKDPEGQTPFVFNGSETMPANAVVVFAVWKPDDVMVTYNTGTGATIPSQTVKKGEKITKPPNPERADYEFAGWVKEDGSPFNFNAPLTENVNLVAQWITDKGYRIHYDPGKGTGLVQVGPKLYAPGSPARIVGISDKWHWQPPEGNVGFLHWNTMPDDSGKIYYPGEELYLTSDTLTLYAIWSKNIGTKLTYDLNYDDTQPSASEHIFTQYLEDNSTVEVGSGGISPKLVRNGYRFVGWTRVKKQDAAHPLIPNGETIQVSGLNEDTENVLYAQWVRVIDIHIKKIVEGNAASQDKHFTYDWTLYSADGTRTLSGAVEAAGHDLSVLSESLKNVSEGTVVVITERDESGDGYTLTNIQNSENVGVSDVGARTWSYTVQKDANDMTVVFTSEKNQDNPTGVSTQSKHWLLLMLPTLALVVFFRKRRDEMYDETA